MNRREAIERVALLLGGTVIGAEFFLSGCKQSVSTAENFFDTDNLLYLNEIGETILPKTSSPGAKEAKVGEFMAIMVKDCYSAEDQKVFMAGLDDINQKSNKQFDHNFIDCTPQQKTELLTSLDTEQKKYGETKEKDGPNHYFRMLKELTLLGYFTSEVGCTKAMRYLPVPGKFVGTIPYKKGDKAWA